jgi:hypothetical protein
MDEFPNTPIDAWRQLIGIVGLRKSNILFVLFALAGVAFCVYEGRLVAGLFILAFAMIHAARLDTLLLLLIGDGLRRLWGLDR